MNKHPRICLSAGHGTGSRAPGREDPGASVAGEKDKTESDYVLNMCKSVVTDLKMLIGARGEVFLRNHGHYSKADDFAAENACDIFLELHLNAGGGTGTEVLYRDGADISFARKMGEAIAKALDVRFRGVRYRGDVAVLRPHRGMKQVLVELWFADNPLDKAKHNARRDAECLAIENTILEELGWKTVKTRPSKMNKRHLKRYRPFRGAK